MTQKVCPYCRQKFRHSIYHPRQVVCSSAECQSRRRAEYHRKKISEDPNYRDLCRDSQTYWKEKNPGYMKRYRAKSKNHKSAADEGQATLDEVLRLLRQVKNTAAKNNSAVKVTRSLVEVLWVTATDASPEKNNLAKAKLIVVEDDLNPVV